MSFTPPTGPVIDEPLRPRALWYWIGGLVIAAGVGGAIALFVIGFVRLDDTVDDFERVGADTGGTVTLDAGEYVVYAENTAFTPSRSADVTVTAPDGDLVSLAPYGGELTYGFGGRNGIALATFSAEESGDYELTPSTTGAPGGVTDFAVGSSVADDIASFVLTAILVGGAGVVIGGVMILVTGIRRGKAKRARTPPGPPPATWGQAPSTWGPQPAQPGWGQPPGPRGAPPGPQPPPPGQAPPPPPNWPG